MSLGTLTLACLMMTANAELPKVWHLPDRKFSIPIRIQPARRSEIQELRLYTSRDEGMTWQLTVTTSPEKTEFPFTAPADGSYWFKVAIVNKSGKQEPEDIQLAAVGQRLVVDTQKPLVQFTEVVRQGNNVLLKWTSQESYPDPSSLKVEYQTTDAVPGLWTPIPNLVPGSSETSFSPGTTSGLTFRVSLTDQAGNVGEATYELPGVGGASQAENNLTAMLPKAEDQHNPLGGEMAPLPAMPEAVPQPPFPSSPTPTPTPLVGYEPQPQGGVGTPTGHGFQPLEQMPSGDPAPHPGIQRVASSTDRNLQQSRVTNPGFSPNNPRHRVPRKVINQLQAKLDFEVTDYGPSGLGTVDVWYTLDGGLSWKPIKPDAPPAYPDVSGTVGKGPVVGQVSITLPGQGDYGLYLVVKSAAGLGIEDPTSGTNPHMHIEVDTTMPEAELFQPKADKSRPNSLLLSWDARDRKLATNPISIEWAKDPQGPWNFIGGPELPNSKSYTWQLPASIPPLAYLKLTVRDAAGNIAVAQTSRPVLLDVKTPTARIIGLSSGQ